MMPEFDGSVQPPFESPAAGPPSGRSPRCSGGRVYLVGAGPGDPGLLTIRGRECLELADIVLYDGLANEQMLEFAERAEWISVGKHGQIPIWTQAAINQKMVELARAGHVIVRLKGGDPAVFARTAEELDVLIREKIDFEVVPGITAALAAASYVGIPITHRHHASAVALITGQQQSDEAPQEIDWQALSRFPGTIVFYMGVTTVAEWTSNLIRAGKSADTPAAIIRRCTWSDQEVVRCQLGEVADRLTPASKMRPPVIVIIGAVAALGQDFDWFTSRPLHGCGILVARSAHQSGELVHRLRQLGAEVFQQPVFRVAPPNDLTSLKQTVAALAAGEVHGITFSSTNGVDGLLRFVDREQLDARIFAGVRIAAVGNATAKQLAIYGLRCDVVAGQNAGSAEQSAAGLVNALRDSVHSQSWIVTTTNRSRPELQKGLLRAGAVVSTCLAYETQAEAELRPHIMSALKAGRIHLITITSSFVAEASFNLFSEFHDSLQPVCFGANVARKLEQLGWPAAATACENSSASLAEAILATWEKGRS